MYCFHVYVHARHPGAVAGPAIELRGQRLPTLRLPNDGFPPPWDVCFETAMTGLSALPRMFAEPDGSFVWVSPDGEPRWQVDGVLYDARGQLQYTEMKGTCPPDSFDRLMAALGHPAAELMFQLAAEAVHLDAQAFRRYAAV